MVRIDVKRKSRGGGDPRRESNPRIKAIWERFLDYELGHVQFVGDLLRRYEGREPDEILAGDLPKPVAFTSQRDFVRGVLQNEVDLRAVGTEYVPKEAESEASIAYRREMDAEGSPTQIVASGYRFTPEPIRPPRRPARTSARSPRWG